MKLQENVIKEFNDLSSREMMLIYDMILNFKERKNYKPKKKATSFSYKSIRNCLSSIKGSLSEDIISNRKDRI